MTTDELHEEIKLLRKQVRYLNSRHSSGAGDEILAYFYDIGRAFYLTPSLAQDPKWQAFLDASAERLINNRMFLDRPYDRIMKEFERSDQSWDWDELGNPWFKVASDWSSYEMMRMLYSNHPEVLGSITLCRATDEFLEHLRRKAAEHGCLPNSVPEGIPGSHWWWWFPKRPPADRVHLDTAFAGDWLLEASAGAEPPTPTAESIADADEQDAFYAECRAKREAFAATMPDEDDSIEEDDDFEDGDDLEDDFGFEEDEEDDFPFEDDETLIDAIKDNAATLCFFTEVESIVAAEKYQPTLPACERKTGGGEMASYLRSARKTIASPTLPPEVLVAPTGTRNVIFKREIGKQTVRALVHVNRKGMATIGTYS